MARNVMVGAREYQAGGYSRSGRENGVGSLCRYADAVGLTESGERPVAGKWWRSVVPDRDDPPPVVDTSVAHPARVYDYWLGGKDNFAADREVGEQTLRAYPALALALRRHRAFLAAGEAPYGLVAKLMDAMPPGSFLVVAHPTADFSPEEAADSIGRYNDQVAVSATLRNREDTVRFFDGLDLVEPGVVATSKWRPDTEQEAASPSTLWAGVGRKA